MGSLAWTYAAYIVSTLLLYLLLVRLLRYRHRDAILRNFPDRASFRNMTLNEAYEIQSRLVETEFPAVFSGSVFFALFKTYDIPSISKLLANTGQLSSSNTASKRAADTAVLMTEIVLHPPNNPRAIDGLARINYLHDRYRRAGKVSDEDMLYTLSLFVLEPIRWTERFEWRRVSDAEKCGMGMYWRYLGQAMEIPFTALKSGEKGWKDGLEFLGELEEWSLGYEADKMKFTEANRLVADKTLEIGLFNVPQSLHWIALDFVSYLLDERLKRAMGFSDASNISAFIFDSLLATRRNFLRYFALPRPHIFRWRWFADRPDANDRLHTVQYVAHPWYVQPSWYNRWGLNALLLRLTGGMIPGEPGTDAFHPEGYLVSELGPEKMRGAGEAEMQETRAKLRESQQLGCPFFAF